MNTPRTLAAAAAAMLAAAAPARAADPGAPPAATDSVTDTYHGVAVADPYRWLENGDDPKVRAWTAAEEARTRGYLDALPLRGRLHDRIAALMSGESAQFTRLTPAGGTIFAALRKPAAQQRIVVALGPDLDPANARAVIDPNAIDPSGQTAIDWWVPSPDGKLIAASLSVGGSEAGTLHVFDAATGKDSGLAIAEVQYPTGGGSVAWAPDASGFWYTRYPGPSAPEDQRRAHMKVFYHVLGQDPARDAYVIGNDFPAIAEISLDARQNPRHVLMTVANGDGGEYMHFVLDRDAGPRQLTRFEDHVVDAALGPDDVAYLVSRRDAPRGKLLALTLSDGDVAKARVIVPESDAVIPAAEQDGPAGIAVTADALYVRELVGGPYRVAVFAHDGTPRGTLPLPDIASVNEVVGTPDGAVLYDVVTYLTPQRWRRYDAAASKAVDTRLAMTSPVSFDDAEVLRVMAKSEDGTEIPINIVRKKGTKPDGKLPVLLEGYGGYGISLSPEFAGPLARVWLDGGGVYAVANLRGGGEFGEAWHLAGNLTRKQTVFDDFAACTQYFFDAGYTTPARMAAIGGSNGGLLMGAEMTQHPSMFRAIVSLVGIYDALRSELEPNGAYNITEFGTVTDPEQFKALYAYSPYHHVVPGTAYPAVLFTAGQNDGRVEPLHSRKMAARMQAATASGRPIYLSVSDKSGHGIGSALGVRIDQYADIQAFLFDQLGMTLPTD